MLYKLEKPVRGTIGNEKYQCTIEWRNGKFTADEPVTSGGKDTGPDPFTLLLSSLVSCTLATMRMYIDRKGWPIPDIAVSENMYQEIESGKTTTTIDCEISFPNPIDEAQKDRLHIIARRCPISRILGGEVIVRTS